MVKHIALEGHQVGETQRTHPKKACHDDDSYERVGRREQDDQCADRPDECGDRDGPLEPPDVKGAFLTVELFAYRQVEDYGTAGRDGLS